MNTLKHSIVAATVTLLTACGNNGSSSAEKPSGVTPAMAADCTAAATGSGTYRPDTARVYCSDNDIDTSSEFIVISKKALLKLKCTHMKI